MTKLTLADMVDGAQSLQTGLALYNKDMELLFVNSAAKQNFPALYNSLEAGLPIHEAMAMQARSFRPDISDEALKEAVEASLKSFQKSSRRTIPLKDGRWIDTWHTVTETSSFIALSLDITERVQRESDLEKARQLAAASNVSKSEFIAAISHEVRTPLNGIQGVAQILLQADLAPEHHEMLQIIMENSQSLAGILNNIIDISKLETDKLKLVPVNTDIRQHLKRIRSFYAPLAAEKGLDFQLALAPGLPQMILIDPVRLRQCIANLLSNAIKFTHEGKVTMAVTSANTGPAQEQITIHVQDTGIGVHPDYREKLFEKFTQQDASTTRNFGGTGLGLPLARELAHLMGGDITLATELGAGSVFTLTFKAKKHEPLRVIAA